ncbi:MAG: aldo/keto reductase [Rhodovibrionaceae bacterium]|nr:aldo/keto reductase [Rhodovibrionaceae bacterium]
MDYRNLGVSGLKVSPICLGTMMFGGPTDEEEAAQIIDHARNAGVNFIDIADMYNAGKSEEIVGRALAKDRESWVVATKVGNPMGEGPNQRGLSRAYVIRACEASLARLAMDHVDIYYLHTEDHDTPLEETVSALEHLWRAGKIRYVGVSNFRAWRIAELTWLMREAGMGEPVVCQPYYNAMNRMPEVEILPACAHYGIGVVPFSPLARGVLTGKYAPDTEPVEGTRAARRDERMMQTEWRRESLVASQKIKAHAEAVGISAAQFAVAWVLNNALVDSVLAGPRTLEHWEHYLGALDYVFTEEDEALIDSLVAPGHPSTPGYTDPKYPVEGRLVF